MLRGSPAPRPRLRQCSAHRRRQLPAGVDDGVHRHGEGGGHAGRRRSAPGRDGHGRACLEGGTRGLGGALPHLGRGRQCRRGRSGRNPAAEALPLVHAGKCLDLAASGQGGTRARRRAGCASQPHSGEPPPPLRHEEGHCGGLRPGQLLRAQAGTCPHDDYRLRAPGRPGGGGCGEPADGDGRRHHGRGRAQAAPLHRPGGGLPSARCFPDRHAGRDDGAEIGAGRGAGASAWLWPAASPSPTRRW